jgi:hypothetical protein
MRPRRYDKAGFLVPTALEIEEGEAFRDYRLHPKSRILREEWEALSWRIYTEQGPPATTRCASCCTVRYGRPCPVPCAVCGSTERRYE